MRIIFVGNVLPEDVFAQTSKVSPSTNNVQLRYIQMLSQAFPGSVEVVSSNFKLAHLVSNSHTVPRMDFELSNNVIIQTAAFRRNRLLQSISLLFDTIRLIKETRNKNNPYGEKVLFVVNNHYYIHALPVYIGKKEHDKMITILNECFDVRYSYDHKIDIRDHINNLLHRFLIKKNDGLITFSQKTVEDYAGDQPYISLVYSCEYDEQKYQHQKRSRPEKMILYAGLIAACYGINEIIDAMSFLSDDYRLVVCGGGSQQLIERLNEEGRKSGKIEFRGMIPRDQVIQLEQEADVLLLIRTQNTVSEKYVAKYSQPSKIPEYMLSKTPVLATNIDSIPRSLKEYLNFCNTNPEDIADAIVDICEKNRKNAMDKANRAHIYAKENCNVEKQSHDIISFINSLMPNSKERAR